MTIGADDIEIFVLTYNRSHYLPATLDSILSQSIGSPRVTVLDNASTDNTTAVLAPYVARGVRHLVAPQNLGWQGNLARAQQLSERDWTMAFHDDDLMHPAYLEAFTKAVANQTGVALVASGMSFEEAPTADNWPLLPTLAPLVCSRPADLAGLLYRGFPLHFGSAIYRTTVFRRLRWDAQYGKIADRPFLLEAAQDGAAIVFPDSFVRYRLHAGQDSGAADSGPFVPQLAALHTCFARLLGTSPWTRNGRIFLSQFVTRLKDEFPRLASRDRETYVDAEAYIEAARLAAGLSPGSLAISRMYWLLFSTPRQFAKRLLGR